MKNLTLLIFLFFLVGISLSSKAQSYVPLSVTGWNGDLVANGGNSHACNSVSQGFDNSGNVYYSTDFTSSNAGSPPCSGVPSSLTSPNGPVYNIGWINSTLILNPNNGSGTLTFTNPGAFDHLSLLAASANNPSGTATLNVQVNFSDNTNFTTTFTVQDWYTGNQNIALTTGRVTYTGCTDSYNDCGSIKLYDEVINLSGYSTKVVTSIYCWNSDSQQRCGVFAVCGVTAQGSPQPPVATAGTSITGTSFNCNWTPAGTDPYPATSYVLDVSTDPNFGNGNFVNGLNNYNVGNVGTYPVSGLLPGHTYYYRVRGVNGVGQSPNSNVITVQTLSCINPNNGGTIAASQAHCGPSYTPAAFTNSADASGYTGTLEYKWQYSVAPFSTWTDIPSSNSNTYAPGSISVTTEFQRLARVNCMSDWSGAAVSNILTATVYPLPTAYNVTGGGGYCIGGTGVDVGLSGSDEGISYALYNGASLIATLPGSGAPLDYGLIIAAGTYTVVATNTQTFCVNNMGGSAIVVINPLPAQFNVTGGGSYCAQGTGVGIGLSGSATGITYALYNGASLITTMTGTGSALNFGLQTGAGTYTVVATNNTTSCVNNMIGSATVIILPLPTPVISGSTSVHQGTSATYTTPLVAGHSYSWSVVYGTYITCDLNCIIVNWPYFCDLQVPGQVTVTETNLSTGCQQTVTLFVTVNP